MNWYRQILFCSIRALLCAVFAACVVSNAFGQAAATNGSITGVVTDNSSAVVPGATVSVSNPATNFSRQAVSDSGGEFAIRDVPPGTYNVVITHEGFKKAEYPNVLVNVGTNQQIRSTLDIGQTSETVQVTGESVAVVDTEKTEVSDVISQVQVQQLPLNQRSFTSMVTQQPGIVSLSNTSNNAGQTPTSVTWAQGSQISANGQVSANMAYLIDGVNFGNSGFGAPGTAAGGDVPGVEGIQEFQVLSANYSAQYGGSAGAVVSFATKSGTNNWHGSLYEYLRNDKLDSESYFDTAKFPYHRNQFGGTLGGPIKKDKTFFFLNYEGLQQAYTTSEEGNVPSLCARNGGVGGSGVGCPGGVPFLVTNNYAPGGPVPVAISAGTAAILPLYPLPNGRDYGNGIAQVFFPDNQPISQQYGLMRIDQTLTKNDTLTGRYTITDAGGSNAYQLPTYEFLKYDRLQNFMLKWTHTFGSSKVNTLAFGWNRSLLEASVVPTVQLQPDQYTGNPARMVVGTISVGSATSGNTSGALSTIGTDNWGPFKGADSSWPITDDFEWTLGRHSIKIGGGFGWREWNWTKGNLIGGGYTFNSLNDLLAGQVAVLIIRNDQAVPQWNVTTHPVAWYLEDTWKATRKLTVTAGLRQDFQVPVLSNEQNFGNVRSNQDSGLTIASTPYNNYSFKQVQPRLGMAWDPYGQGKTVVRVGGGLFYSFVGLGPVAGELTYNDPQSTINSFFGQPDGGARIPWNQSTQVTAPSNFPGLLTAVTNVNPPETAQWNMQIAQELPGKITMTLSYVGSASWHLMGGYEGNYNLPGGYLPDGQPYFYNSPGGAASKALQAQIFSLYSVAFNGRSNYNAGTADFNRKFNNGLSLQASYTWAKAMSDTDTNNSGAILLGNASHYEYPGQPTVDWSESLISFRNRFVANAIYDLPFGQGHKYGSNMNKVENAFLGGWSLNVLNQDRSGFPFSVLAGFGITGVGDNLTYPDRTDESIPNPVIGNINNWFNAKAYYLQTPGTLGNAPRNSVIGPGFNELDFGVSKAWKITERAGLQFRADMFNILNHPNFNLPANQLYTPGAQFINSNGIPYLPSQAQLNALPCSLTAQESLTTSCNPQAGVITSTVGSPRQIQLALRLTF
jgi:hypothetical protein